MTKVPGVAENWENGSLGLDAQRAERVPEAESAEIMKAAGMNMQAISIRMPRDLINVLKEIAKYHGVGYQPMVRDLLHRWAVGEIKSILDTRLQLAKKEVNAMEKSEPLAGDLRKSA